MGSKGKNKWMGLDQTTKFLYSKETSNKTNQMGQKATDWMGNDICKQQLWQGVNIQNT